MVPHAHHPERSRRIIFKSLSQIIHDLAVSKPTFERDFDNNYRRIESQKINYARIDYERYKKWMIKKKKKGEEHKKINLKKIYKL